MVLHLIKGLGRGGAEKLLTESLRYQDRTKFRHLVAYLLGHKDAFVSQLRADEIEVCYLKGERGLGWVPRLRRLVKQKEISIMHAHSPVPAAFARLGLMGTQTSIVYTEHNVWDHYRAPTRILNRLTYPLNDYVFAVSNEVKDSVRSPLGGRSLLPPTETLYHGLDPARVSEWRASASNVRAEFGIDKDALVIGMVAKFRYQKAHDVLLKAALTVREVIPQVHFMFVGSGPLEGTIKEESARLGLDGITTFAGSREDIGNFYPAFDVFVLPSRFEGLPIALLEAMAMGKACVVTAVSGSS